MKLAVFIVCLITAASAFGYVNNIFRLATKDDFAAPYQAEVLRGVGVVVPPVGVILGYVSFNEEASK